MTELQPPEHEEKWDEKRHEKEEKPRAWGGEEKWQRDALSAIIWAAALVCAGLVLLADNLDLLPAFLEGRGWSLAFLAAGGLFLLEDAMRYLLPEYRRPVGGTLIFAAVLIGIGLSGLGLGVVIWPLIVIAIGISILVNALRRS